MSFSLPAPKMKKWSMPRRTKVASYRVFDVMENSVEDAEGRPRRDVFTFACPDWCNVVALTEANEVVMVWQYRFGTDALSLEIPGGVIDAGEAPPDAAKRELREETGYDVTTLEPLLTVEPNPALQGNRCFTFFARGARLVHETAFDENEELEVVLVPVDRIAEVLDQGHVTHALVQSALEVFLRKRR